MKHAKSLPTVQQSDIDYFFHRVIKGNTPDDCWLWVGETEPKGYAVMRVGPSGRRTRYKSHRFSCFIHHGPPPENLPEALHSCDYKSCTNPRHLRWGENGENRKDWHARGDTTNFYAHIPKGEENGQSKLTEEAVREIRNSQLFDRELAVLFGVSRQVVNKARRGETWKHV